MKIANDIRFSSELAFLRLCLEACLFPEENQLITPVNLDWLRFRDLLIQNKLAGLFLELGNRWPTLWPDQLTEQLRNERYGLVLYGDWCENQAKIVLTAMNGANIPAIVLKGWALVQILYGGEYHQRPSGDIDLLVNPQDISPVDHILNNLGFRDTSVEPWPGYFRRYMNSRHYQSTQTDTIFGKPFYIDIHWGIPDLPFYNQKMTVEPFFDRSQPIKIASIETSCLSMEDHLIYTCSHFAHHGYDMPLSANYEIAAILLRSMQTLDWNAVFSRSSTLRVALPLQRVLSGIASLWPRVIPAGIMETLARKRPSRLEHSIDWWLVKSKNKGNIIAILSWFTIPGVFRKFSYILETLIPSPAYLSKYYGPAPLGLWPLLYPKRLAVVLLSWFT